MKDSFTVWNILLSWGVKKNSSGTFQYTVLIPTLIETHRRVTDTNTHTHTHTRMDGTDAST